jgi:hypothetical protein
MAEVAELRAIDVLSQENLKSDLFLTKSKLERRYHKGRSEIVYFLENDEPHDKIAKQQAVLKFAKETGGWVFTGIHSETDWSETRWWSAGWHICNRTGEYAVVFEKGVNHVERRDSETGS